MSNRVCPWWLGYFLLNPLRGIIQSPEKILREYIGKEMKVLDIGCGMGYFTLPIARILDDNGRVIAVDLQQKMLQSLNKRAKQANLLNKIEARLCTQNSLKIDDLSGEIDFVLAFAVVHEIPDKEQFFNEVDRVLRRGGMLLIAEPKGHVKEEEFNDSIGLAQSKGFYIVDRPKIGRSLSVVLKK
ncbi:MAG: class I SAM-dependent methyltransferase [Thermotaleaceae bacterium]